MITRIHHIALKCSDEEQFEKTLGFYTEIIGMKVIRRWAAGAMVELGGDIIEIFNSGRVLDSTGSINHFAFFTDDPDDCIRRVREAGYRVTVEPKDVDMKTAYPVQDGIYPIRVAFCVGPVGEEIEFFAERK